MSHGCARDVVQRCSHVLSVTLWQVRLLALERARMRGRMASNLCQTGEGKEELGRWNL